MSIKVYAYKRNADNENWQKVGIFKAIDEVLPKGNYEKLEVTNDIIAFKEESLGIQYLFLRTDKKFVKQLEIDGRTGFSKLKEAIDDELKAVNNSISTAKHDPLDELNIAYTKAINYKRD